MASTATGVQMRFETVQASRSLAATGWMGDLECAAEFLLPQGALDFHDPELEERSGLAIPDLSELGEVIAHPESIGIASSLGHLASDAYQKAPSSFRSPASLRLQGLRIVTELGETLEDETRFLVAFIKQEEKIKKEKAFMEKVIRRSSDRHLTFNERALKIYLATLRRGYSLSNDNMDRLATHMPSRIIAEKGKVEPVTLELS